MKKNTDPLVKPGNDIERLIDTHCHLDWKDYDDDRDEVVQRSIDAGVTRVVSIGTTLETSAAAVNIAQRYPGTVFATVGFHPEDSGRVAREDSFLDEWPAILAKLEELIQENVVVGIGECGLDYYRKGYNPDVQERVFRDQLELALRHNLPVVLHIRDAHKESITILKDYPGVRAVVHCFTGSLDIAKQYVEELGLLLSFTGIVTFPEHKIPDLFEVVHWIPQGKFLLETDAPFLSPAPFRGKRNEPSRIVQIAQRVAEMRGESQESIARQTTLAAESFFSLSD